MNGDDDEMYRGDYERDRAIDDELLEAAARRPVARARTDQLATKLLPGYVARLRALCDSEGMTVAEAIESWVERAEKATWPSP